jgi:beta-aspartyl-peptidase (threonine type)
MFPLVPRFQTQSRNDKELKTLVKIAVVALAIAFCGAPITQASEPNGAAREIEAVLHAQQDAWNRGDIDAFMNGYWRSDQTAFVSGDEVTRGWQKVLDRYKKKYSDRAKMGTLTFSNLEINPISDESVIALGRWKLKRANDDPHGRFTLILRKFPDGWKIVHDHTSAAAE